MSDFDTTNPMDVEEAEHALKERQAYLKRLEDDDFKWLMSDKRGRRFMYRMLSVTKTFSNPFVPGRGDLTSYQCGAQSVGQMLLADIHEHCPERYETMLTEQTKL